MVIPGMPLFDTGFTTSQFVTGLPLAIRDIQDGLSRLLERDGLTLAGAVGADANLYVVRDRPPARTPSGT